MFSVKLGWKDGDPTGALLRRGPRTTLPCLHEPATRAKVCNRTVCRRIERNHERETCAHGECGGEHERAHADRTRALRAEDSHLCEAEDVGKFSPAVWRQQRIRHRCRRDSARLQQTLASALSPDGSGQAMQGLG
eukprot:scaffold307300_cov32-Tisochrysis_lutea.AAC.1